MSHLEQAYEMSRHQRALIDTCFEEGQYESGIALFDQLRMSAKCYPSAAHIRQLLYLSLFTPSPLEEKLASEPASPSKMVSRQQKLAHVPTLAASSAAQQLLVSLVSSTPPAILLRGLPSYQGPTSTTAEDDADSFVARQAKCILQARDCWCVLKEGFIHEGSLVSKTNIWHRRQIQYDEDETQADSPMIVADNAWPLLEWLILVFQQDELNNTGSFQHSPLLLSQIPSPRDNAVARWETDAALDIVFYCLQQSDERRQDFGIQLLTMLIHLWSARLLDMQVFIASVYKRISTCQESYLLNLLGYLGAIPSTIEFRITICQKFLSMDSTARERPRPQARIQPRAVRGAQNTHHNSLDAPADTTTDSSTSRQSILPSIELIMQLLKEESHPETEERSQSLIMRVKFELLMSYGTLQSSFKPTERNPAWVKSLQAGEVLGVIDVVFGNARDDSGTALLGALNIHVLKWINA